MLQRTATTRASSSRIFVVQPSSYSARNLHQFNGHPHLRSDIVIQEAPSSVSRSALRLRHTRAPLLQHLQSPSFPKHRRWQSTSSNPDPQAGRPSWLSRLRTRLGQTPVRWKPLPIAGGIAVLVLLSVYKQAQSSSSGEHRHHGIDIKDGTYDHTEDNMPRVQGPWQVHVIGALPLRTISRIYGYLNSYTLPTWFRVPGYKLYSYIFGVNLDEMEPADLQAYSSMSEFFMRRLKDGVRPIADGYALVSPVDGRVVNFGYVDNRRVEQVKGVSYSLDDLLSGKGRTGETVASAPSSPPNGEVASGDEKSDPATVNEEEFANLNGLSYTIDQLMGTERHSNQDPEAAPESSSSNRNTDSEPTIKPAQNAHDASIPSSSTSNVSSSGGGPAGDSRSGHPASMDASEPTSPSITEQLSLGAETYDATSPHWTLRGVPKGGNRMFFCVIYLAPGDYHRFHSPTNWVVERRRHFPGELFSVSPYMTKLLKDLFVLNERVALLGRWRYGFFSYVPVGATNVGSIRINFDADLRTNSPLKPKKLLGEYSEATYTKSSTLLQGKPLRMGDEMGAFALGSTIVLVFEAPEDFAFAVKRGEKIKLGEPLADRREVVAKRLAELKMKEMLGS